MKQVVRRVQEKLSPAVVSERNVLQGQLNELRARHDFADQHLKIAIIERDALVRDKDEAFRRRHMDRVIHHQPWRLAGKAGVVQEVSQRNDEALAGRVAAAYRGAVLTPVGSTDSMWLNEFASANRFTHETLMEGSIESVTKLLRDPASSMLFYGFDSLQSRDTPDGEPEPWWVAWNHQLAYDGLLQLARAVGVRRTENPEANQDFDEAPKPEELLAQLDERFGFRIDFPNLFAGELGVHTSRGVANIRAIYALYQAWRTKTLVAGAAAPRVLEIGAGLGRSAYYASKFGITDYTIIDIPLTGVSQGYYLGNVLGESAVSLWGETATGSVRVLPPVAYDALQERFDLVVNVDSLTEMARSTAEGYLRGGGRITGRFLSINHEHNSFTVESVYREIPGASAWRTPCWIRRGYVEEVIEFRKADQNQ